MLKQCMCNILIYTDPFKCVSHTCRSNKLKYQLNLYQLRENRQIKPKAFMHMVSNLLYSRRYIITSMTSYVCLYVLYYPYVHVYVTLSKMHPYYLICLHVHGCRFGYYFVEPVIVGLDQKTNDPYIATMDLIGCPMETTDFVVAGTCSEQLYGMCESLWKPDLVRSKPHPFII